MCQLFAHQPQRDYESQTRSLRIDGHCTSIRLEMAFWDTLEEIANKEDMSLAKFLTKLHSEVLDHCGEVHNFASLLRCSCLIYRSRAAAVLPDFVEARAARCRRRRRRSPGCGHRPSARTVIRACEAPAVEWLWIAHPRRSKNGASLRMEDRRPVQDRHDGNAALEI